MGNIIEEDFKNKKSNNGNNSNGNKSEEGRNEEGRNEGGVVIKIFRKRADIEEIFGQREKLTVERNMGKLRNFIFSFLATKLGNIKKNFFVFTYVSNLMAESIRIEFERIIDIMQKIQEKGNISGVSNIYNSKLIGDASFRLVTIFREKIENSPPMKIKDYEEIGRAAYANFSSISKNPELFYKMAQDFSELAYITYMGLRELK